jgi:transcription antitermination factor NusG
MFASLTDGKDLLTLSCASTPARNIARPKIFPIESASLPWYGIRTKSNQEKLATLFLASKGYAPYLPLYSERRRWSDRTVITERPLFPGYFFCRFDAAQRRGILTTPGIVSVLGFNNQPAPIPSSEIEAVEAVVRSGVLAQPCPFLREGQRIRVTYGSLEGLEGILIRQKTEWRLVVSINMLQRSISVEVNRDCITTL